MTNDNHSRRPMPVLPVRFPAATIRAARREAKKNGTTLSAYVRESVEERIKKESAA